MGAASVDGDIPRQFPQQRELPTQREEQAQGDQYSSCHEQHFANITPKRHGNSPCRVLLAQFYRLQRQSARLVPPSGTRLVLPLLFVCLPDWESDAVWAHSSSGFGIDTTTPALYFQSVEGLLFLSIFPRRPGGGTNMLGYQFNLSRLLFNNEAVKQNAP